MDGLFSFEHKTNETIWGVGVNVRLDFMSIDEIQKSSGRCFVDESAIIQVTAKQTVQAARLVAQLANRRCRYGAHAAYSL